MTSPGGSGDTTMLQRPLEAPYYYGEPEAPIRPTGSPELEEQQYRQPEPVVSLVDPKVALALAGVALLVGFALATLLFGVILNDDSETIAGTGTEAPTIDDGDGTDALNPLAAEAVTGADESPTPLNSDGAVVPPVDGAEPAMTDSSMVDSTTTVAVATTVAVTVAPTSAATTAAPTTIPTTVTTAPTTVTTAPASSTTAMADTGGNPPPPPPASGGDGAVQQQVLDLTNAERAKAGCNAVILDPTLNSVADAHSEDMAANNYFDHTGLNGSQPWDRVQAAGYPARGSGENIAQGYSSAADVVTGWMNSPGHRRNMLDCSWTELGVGYAEGSGARGNIRPLYWTQVFASRR